MVLSPPRWELQSKLPSSSLFQRELVPRSIEVDFPLRVQNQSIVSLAFSLLPSPQFMPLSPYHGLIAPPHPSMTEYRLLPPLPPPPVTPRHIEVDDDLILFLPPPPLLEHTFSLQSILSSLLSTVQPLPLSISFLLPTASFNYAVHTTPPPTPSHESYLLSEPFASLDFLYPLPPPHTSPTLLPPARADPLPPSPHTSSSRPPIPPQRHLGPACPPHSLHLLPPLPGLSPPPHRTRRHSPHPQTRFMRQSHVSFHTQLQALLQTAAPTPLLSLTVVRSA